MDPELSGRDHDTHVTGIVMGDGVPSAGELTGQVFALMVGDAT